MYKLSISGHAEKDLDETLAYISGKLSAPQAANGLLDGVYECYKKIVENPFMFEKCRDPKLEEKGYRRAVVKNYILLYEVNEDAKVVMVHRFFYGRQDYPSRI